MIGFLWLAEIENEALVYVLHREVIKRLNWQELEIEFLLNCLHLVM